jgi:hypothetical protein
MSGGFTPALVRSDVAISGQASFLASEKMTVKRGGITLDALLVTADSDGNKIVPAGTFVSEVTATGKYGPYAAYTNEVQTITEGGSGLTTYTLSYAGQTTAAIAADATAAAVKAALEALSNIAVGDVAVTGDAEGPYTVTFGGTKVAADIAEMTATPTGGTGTVTIATEAAGGAESLSDGRQTPSVDTSGYLLEGVNLRNGDVICGLLIAGSVLTARVTPVPNATIKAAVGGRILFQ